MKRFLILTALLLGLLSIGALAAGEPAFRLTLTTEENSELTVATGDVITVTVMLNRADSQKDYIMYAMQNEILYDKAFFRLVEDSDEALQGVQIRDMALRDHRRAHYVNYVSMAGGVTWPADTVLDSFQLEVIGTTGVSRVENSDARVSLPDGSGSYAVSSQDLTVIISEQCEITFESNGGVLSSVLVKQGERLNKPAAPTRLGYTFDGWYKDIDCREPWDFSRDTVQVNTRLYAKWNKIEGGQRYVDVLPDDWFFGDVDYVSAHGLMDGVGEGRFAPNSGTNRAMIVTILWRLEGKPTGGGGTAFADVPTGQWYTQAIAWASANGIVTGYSDKAFGPMDSVTREQMAVILYRYARFKGLDVSARADITGYADNRKVSDWAIEGLSWANAEGLISGMADHTLAPGSSALRCQTAAILHRFHEKLR